jgi:Flp pilus assembly protein TadG
MTFPSHNDIRSERGQTMTEFAIVLPVLCLLLFGVIQFGILWNNYVTLTDAVRAGARKAAVSRRSDPIAAGCNQVRSAGAGLNQAELTCGGSVAGDLSHPGGDVTITASYPYDIDLFGFVLASGRLESTTTERTE